MKANKRYVVPNQYCVNFGLADGVAAFTNPTSDKDGGVNGPAWVRGERNLEENVWSEYDSRSSVWEKEW